MEIATDGPMVWTDENTQLQPTPYNMDGHGRVFRVGDSLLLVTKYLHSDATLVEAKDAEGRIVKVSVGGMSEWGISIMFGIQGLSYLQDASGPPLGQDKPPPNEREVMEWNAAGKTVPEVTSHFGITPAEYGRILRVYDAAYASVQNGNWNDVATWGGAGFPVAGDTVSIGAHLITVNVASACASITFSAAGTLICGANVVTMTLTFTLNALGTLTASTGGLSGCTSMTWDNVVTCTGAAQFSVAGSVAITGTYTYSTSTITTTAAGTFAATPAIYNWTHNGAGTTQTLGHDLVANAITGTAGTLDTSVANNYAVTVATLTYIGALTFYARNSALSLGSGYTGGWGLTLEAYSSYFYGGTGNHHIIGSFRSSGGHPTMTSGVCTFNSYNSAFANETFSLITGDFHHGNGTVIFTTARNPTLMRDYYHVTNTFYNLQVNNASCNLAYNSGMYFAVVVANALTITAGSFTLWDGTTSCNLTVSGTTDVEDTLNLKAGTHSLAGIVVGSTANASVTATTATVTNSGTGTWGGVGFTGAWTPSEAASWDTTGAVSLVNGAYGAAVAWTGIYRSTLGIAAAVTFTPAQDWRQYGDCTIAIATTYVPNSAVYKVYAAHTLDSGAHTIATVTYNAALQLTISTALTATTFTFVANAKLYGLASNENFTATTVNWTACNIKWLNLVNAVTTGANAVTTDAACEFAAIVTISNLGTLGGAGACANVFDATVNVSGGGTMLCGTSLVRFWADINIANGATWTKGSGGMRLDGSSVITDSNIAPNHKQDLGSILVHGAINPTMHGVRLTSLVGDDAGGAVNWTANSEAVGGAWIAAGSAVGFKPVAPPPGSTIGVTITEV